MDSHESKNEIRNGYEKKKKNEKEETTSGNENGGFLPILPMLGAFGFLMERRA